MKIEKIKPIPKYILEKIKKLDESRNIKPCGQLRFYSYLSKNDGDLCRITVAVKVYKKVWYCKQVAVHGMHSDTAFVHDMEYAYMGGYKVDFYDQGMRQYNAPAWYAKGKWYECEDKYYAPTFAPCVNVEYALKTPSLKYSACDLYKGDDVIEYLRTYEAYPQAEMLVKLGLSRYALSKQILTKIATDKGFRKFLGKNRDILSSSKQIYVSSIISAYKQGKPIETVQELEAFKKELAQPYYKDFRADFKGEEERLFNYLAKQNTTFALYRDYIDACRYLELDLTADRNRYPHDFKRWHDIRIDEMATAKALKNEQERKKYAQDFATVASKYMPLQSLENGAYIVVIAQDPTELVREGEFLHHCVGKMGYDRKFAREESLIFFVRSATDTQTPLATIEFSLKSKEIVQFYADHNTTPDKATRDYVNNVWLPTAQKALKKIAA
jgi:hypothetical protein